MQRVWRAELVWCREGSARHVPQLAMCFRVDRYLDETRDRQIQCTFERREQVVWAFHAEAREPESLGILDEVRIREGSPKGATKASLLVERDDPVAVVCPDHGDKRCAQALGCLQLLRVHQKATVSSDRHDLPLWMHELGSECPGHRNAHGGEAIGDHQTVGASGRKEGGQPELVHPYIGDQDIVVMEYCAQVGNHALGFQGKRRIGAVAL